MSEPHRVETLEITEDLRFQEREWRVQRIGWVLMATLVVLALLGLFSTGPLSSASEQAGDGTLGMDYQRFVRHDGRTTVTFEADGSLASNGEIELWVSRNWFEDMSMQSISPEPDEVRDAGDRRVMVFLIDDPSTTVTVQIDVRPQAIGRISGEAGVVGGPSVSFGHFSYP